MRFAYCRLTDCGLRALDAGAKLLVSGDKRHLLSMNPYRGIALIGIREFIDTYQSYT